MPLQIKAKPMNGQVAGGQYHPPLWREWPDDAFTEEHRQEILTCEALEVRVVGEDAELPELESTGATSPAVESTTGDVPPGPPPESTGGGSVENVSLSQAAEFYGVGAPQLPPEGEIITGESIKAEVEAEAAAEESPPKDEPEGETVDVRIRGRGNVTVSREFRRPKFQAEEPDEGHVERFKQELLAVRGIGRMLASKVLDAGVVSMEQLKSMDFDELVGAGLRPTDAAKVARALAEAE